MARKLRRPQEQLAFPELELAGAPAAMPGPFVGEAGGAAPAPQPEDEPGGQPETPAEVRKAPRRRRVQPTMVLVTESAGMTPVQASAMAAQEEQPEPTPVEPPASLPDAPSVAPPREAVAANEQFLAPSRPAATPTPPAAPAAVTAAGPHRLKAWAHVATISTSLVVVAALFIGSRQFIETEQRQRELFAVQKASLLQERHVQAAEMNARGVELFLRYNDLMQQLNGPLAKNAKKESRYWKEGLAVNLLESLFNLTRGNREWETTIGWALEKHLRFIREQRLSCAAYSPEFVRYLEKTAGAKAVALCKEPTNAD